MAPDVLPLVIAMLCAGAVAGLIGGLFGIGGGVILVPTLYHLLTALQLGGDRAVHIAVATSLATIISTSVASLRSHHRTQNVDWALLRAWTPWIALGAVVGGVIAQAISGAVLAVVFGVLALATAVRFALSQSRPVQLAAELPKGLLQAFLGVSLGIASALMGIGGGVFGVLIMTMCGRSIHQAVATASGFGLAIAVPAVLANIATGWNAPDLPPFSLGYVNIGAALILGGMTAITAPFGARLAHRLDRRKLQTLFAICLAIVALNMIWEGIS